MKKMTAIDWAKAWALERGADDKSAFSEELAFAQPETEITHDQHKELEAFLKEFQDSTDGPDGIEMRPD